MRQPKPPKKICILVEGENERKYLSTLYRSILVRKLNLWEQNPDKLNGKLGNIHVSAQIVVIADTDVLDNANRFIENINQINKIFDKKPIVLLQNKNFEDELIFSCKCSPRKLFNHFQASSVSEFKAKFNCDSRPCIKLSQLNHRLDQMWMQSVHCASNLSEISAISDFVTNSSELDSIFTRK